MERMQIKQQTKKNIKKKEHQNDILMRFTEGAPLEVIQQKSNSTQQQIRQAT
jgi:hypothetical protein